MSKKIPHDKASWLAAWDCGGSLYSENRARDERTGKQYGEWVKGKEIRVYVDPSVRKEYSDAIVSDIYRVVDDAKLLLDINVFSINDIELPIKMYVEGTEEIVDKRKYLSHFYDDPALIETILHEPAIDDYVLEDVLFTSASRDEHRGGRQYADIIITNKKTEIDRAHGIENWREAGGSADFKRGYALISVPNDTKLPVDTVKLVARHEIYHLLFLYGHHEHFKCVAGYADSPCIMNGDISSFSSELCEREKDALQTFWNGLEKDFGTKLIRD